MIVWWLLGSVTHAKHGRSDPHSVQHLLTAFETQYGSISCSTIIEFSTTAVIELRLDPACPSQWRRKPKRLDTAFIFASPHLGWRRRDSRIEKIRKPEHSILNCPNGVWESIVICVRSFVHGFGLQRQWGQCCPQPTETVHPLGLSHGSHNLCMVA